MKKSTALLSVSADRCKDFSGGGVVAEFASGELFMDDP